MPDQSTILSLPLIAPSQAQKHVTMNEALRLLDVVVQLAVEDRTRTAQPASPVTGARHIVAAAPTGAWVGQAGRIALWEGTAWAFFAPLAGWRAFVAAEGALATFDGAGWTTLADGPLVVGQVGVSASPDATNRLAVSSPAILLNHAGAGHQVKINKAAATDTASLLYQSGFSGRAEMGLAGTDDFSIKVSANGASFVTALQINRTSGQVALPAGAAITGTVTGTAVVQSTTDVTAGRLLTTVAGPAQAFRRGNILGTVSQSGGVPTGAVIEQGTNANGRYARYADGTQICWHTLAGLPVVTTAEGSLFVSAEATWTFPIAFSTAPSPSGSVNATTARWLNLRAGGTTTALARVLSPVSDATALSAAVMAVGRWF
jgi:hypothetical protein